jgi:hypothetical protein
LVRNERGGIVGSTTYSRVWEDACQLAFTPAQAASPLAARRSPLAARRAARRPTPRSALHVARRRNSAPEVAKRAGNPVEVLLRRYAGCLDNEAESVNRRIERASRDDIPSEIDHRLSKQA